MAKEGHGVQCLDRAMDILEVVAAAGELGVTEIGNAVGLHVATVHNILRTLAARHYLINCDGRYRLGPAMAALSSRFEPLQALPQVVKPYLERIVAATGEAASSTILIGFSGRLIAFQPGTQSITIQFPQWDWPNAMSLATGRLLVALQQEPNWNEFINRNSGSEPYWNRERWIQELKIVQEQGCCVLQRHAGEQTAIACPIRTAGDVVIAAIGASAPSFRATPAHCAEMLEAVHASAVELSRQLGWKGSTALPQVNWKNSKEETP